MAKKKQTATQKKAAQILATGLARALIGLRTSEAQRIAIRQLGKFQESQTLLQARGFKRQAEDVVERGEESARAIRRNTNTLIGAQRAAQGASGLDIGSGSAAILRLQTKLLGDLDAITVKNNAFRQAFGFKEQALQRETQAQLDRSARKFKESSQRKTGVTNLLSEGLSAFQSFKKAGGTLGFGG